MNDNLLCRRLVLLALLLLASGQPALAIDASPATSAPVHLAWDRVGSPIQIRS